MDIGGGLATVRVSAGLPDGQLLWRPGLKGAGRAIDALASAPVAAGEER